LNASFVGYWKLSNEANGMRSKQFVAIAIGSVLLTAPLLAQATAGMAALKGLAPVSGLSLTTDGKAALRANYTITGGIQTGAIRQAILMPFAEQQLQALRDASITGGNLEQLVDGLGTSLGSAYVARAHYADQQHFTNVSQAVADLISYATATTQADSGSAKYFFANGTTDGKTPVISEVSSILKGNGGETDVFGKSYGLPAGSAGADAYGNSRPFQTEPSVLPIVGPDFFNVPAGNSVYNRGPIMNLVNSPSYPSGHTTYGYTGAILLAVLVPERYQEMIVRGAEYGNDRIIMGAHYAMDVLGGRTLALYDMAHLLANDPEYVGQTHEGKPPIADFQAALRQARIDVANTLAVACGKAVRECAREDTSRFNNPAADEAFYDETQTYNLPVVYPKIARSVEDVSNIAPEAGYLLTSAFPGLTLEQADHILTDTEGPGGGFLDNGSAFGLYSRLNLYVAAAKASALMDLNSRNSRESDF
jgi:hypothetical protein